jgi:S-adenosylmethionine hydrolase
MKGVILGITPDARIVDISHEVAAFEVSEAAFLIAQACPYFPRKTIHVVVVDPGVGTSRRPILLEACGQYFLAPDNGVLTMVANAGKHKARSITNTKFFLPSVSGTFHGRDIFAPCAAHLARGTPPARFGNLIQDHLRLNLSKPFRSGKRTWTGTILKIDRFGNLVTNFETAEFRYLDLRPFEMAVGLEKVTRLARNYQEGRPGEIFLIGGSSGYLEVSLNQGNAAKHLGCGVGAPAELSVW